MQFTDRLRAARTALAHRRTMHVAHRRLTQELASFRTAADRVELDEILSRHGAEETREIRTILYRQDLERQQAAVRQVAGYRG